MRAILHVRWDCLVASCFLYIFSFTVTVYVKLHGELLCFHREEELDWEWRRFWWEEIVRFAEFHQIFDCAEQGCLYLARNISGE